MMSAIFAVAIYRPSLPEVSVRVIFGRSRRPEARHQELVYRHLQMFRSFPVDAKRVCVDAVFLE